MEIRPCRSILCTNQATTSLEAVDENGFISDEADVCQSCKDETIDRFARMRSDAQAFRDQGMPEEELNRIMCERVDIDYYEKSAVS